jgi:hypothetical protein
MELATISSEAVSKDLMAIVSSEQLGSFWAGGSDAAQEGTWRWADSTSFAYTAWAAGEPNHFEGNPENCLEVLTTSTAYGMWNDEKCGSSRPFVCSKPRGEWPHTDICTRSLHACLVCLDAYHWLIARW